MFGRIVGITKYNKNLLLQEGFYRYKWNIYIKIKRYC